MNVSLFTIHFLIQYINDEICESILKDENDKLSGGKITLSIENSDKGIGLYLLNFDEVNLGTDKMKLIRDCVNKVFYDLVQTDEDTSARVYQPVIHGRKRIYLIKRNSRPGAKPLETLRDFGRGNRYPHTRGTGHLPEGT
jgi:hypothetical protein